MKVPILEISFCEPETGSREKSPFKEVLGGQQVGDCFLPLFLAPLGIAAFLGLAWQAPECGTLVVRWWVGPMVRCCQLRPVVRNHPLFANQGPPN
jgi:hypothetical protein